MTSAANEVSVRPIQSMSGLNSSPFYDITDECDPRLDSNHSLVISFENKRKFVLKLLKDLETNVNEDKNIEELIAKVCRYLKTSGIELDANPQMRQQMDFYFNLLRNILRNPKLNPILRTMVMEVIELRATNWLTSDDTEAYYHKKFAQLCEQSLDIIIGNSVDKEVNDKSLSIASTSKTMNENNKTLESKKSSTDSDMTSEINGFVLLESSQNKNIKTKTESSTQTSECVSNGLIVISRDEIQNMKKEIKISLDLTKRMISNLDKCLTKQTNDSTGSSPPVPKPTVKAMNMRANSGNKSKHIPLTSTTTQTSRQKPIPKQTNNTNKSNGAHNCAEKEVQRKTLQTSDKRSTVCGYNRSKPLTAGPFIQNATLNSNETLYLNGRVVKDETIPEGTRMPPNTRFRKTWKVRNTGTKVWTGRTTVRFVWGHSELEPYGKVTTFQAPNLRPGEEGKVTIRFTSPIPLSTTRYESHWRLHHRGQPFGQRLVCKIIVDPLATTTTITTFHN